MIFGNFIAHHMDRKKFLSKINLITAAVADKHWSQYHVSPTENFTFRRLMAGIRREHAKPAQSKAPLTIQLLEDTFQLVRESGRLQEWRTLARMNVQFYATLRWDEVSALRIQNIRPTPQGLVVQIGRSKTDQIGKGDFRPIVATNTPSCPVSIINKYVAMLRYEPGVNGFFQPRITAETANTPQRGIPDKKLAYTAALEELKILLSFLGQDPDAYGEHSGRRGGATTASEAGAHWTDLKLHGGWSSDSSAQKYVEATAKKRNKIPQVLAQAREAAVGIQPLSSSQSSSISDNPITGTPSKVTHTGVHGNDSDCSKLMCNRSSLESVSPSSPRFPIASESSYVTDSQSSGEFSSTVSSGNSREDRQPPKIRREIPKRNKIPRSLQSQTSDK